MNSPSTRRQFLSTVGAAAIAPALASCGLLPALGGSVGPVETPRIRVGAMPIVGAVPLSVAIAAGSFRRRGLDVIPQKIRSGAVAVPGLLKGDLDVTFGNYASFISEQARGKDMRIIAEGSRAAPSNFAIVVPPGSPVRRPADLRGKSIGVNALGNIATLTTSSALRDNGVSATDVRFIEREFPEMTNALQSGEVDAAFLPEPFLTKALLHLGVRKILDPCAGPTNNIPIDGYATTAAFAAKNPNTVRAFHGAIVEALGACADPAVLTTALEQHMKVDRPTADLLSRSIYPLSVSPTAIQRVADLMLSFGSLSQPLDVKQMVV